MAVPATLLEKVKALAIVQNVTAVPDDNIVYFLNNGSRNAIITLPKKLQDYFTVYQEATGVAEQSVTVLDTNLITHVHREDITLGVSYVCREIEDEQRYANDMPTATLLSATKVFPQFYRDRNNIYVRPLLAAGDKIKVAAVVIPVIDDATPTYYDGLENAVVYHATSLTIRASVDFALMDLANKIVETIEGNGSTTGIEVEMPGLTPEQRAEIEQALINAKHIIFNGAALSDNYAPDPPGPGPSPITGIPETVTYIKEEDSEMIESTVLTAREELERAISTAKALTDSNNLFTQKISALAGALGAIGQSLQSVYQSANTYYQMSLGEIASYIASEIPEQVMQKQQEGQQNESN